MVKCVMLTHSCRVQTPCMVGLGSKERALGQAAVAKINSNIKNTAAELKRLIGRRWDEADLQVENEHSSTHGMI